MLASALALYGLFTCMALRGGLGIIDVLLTHQLRIPLHENIPTMASEVYLESQDESSTGDWYFILAQRP